MGEGLRCDRCAVGRPPGSRGGCEASHARAVLADPPQRRPPVDRPPPVRPRTGRRAGRGCSAAGWWSRVRRLGPQVETVPRRRAHSRSPTGRPRRFEPPISAPGAAVPRPVRAGLRLPRRATSSTSTPGPRRASSAATTRRRRLVRVYSHDRQLGRRPLEELFDTFLHEMAHHIEYTEPDSFHARECERVPGRMHSRLFWRILGELKARWADASAPASRRDGTTGPSADAGRSADPERRVAAGNRRRVGSTRSCPRQAEFLDLGGDVGRGLPWSVRPSCRSP